MSDLILKKTLRDMTKDIGKMKRQVRMPLPDAGGFTAGSVLFASSVGYPTEDNANLLWDNTAKKLELDGGNAAGLVAMTLDSFATETDATNQHLGHIFDNVFNPGPHN